ncbi:MAG: hypothetical protein PVI23_12065 [Maricaulaceae bacterium]|jgi:hypothetical protein
MSKRFGSSATTAGAAMLLAATLAVTAAGGAFAQASENPADVIAAGEAERFTFTLRSPDLFSANDWAFDESPELELSAGSKWRFTFSLDSEDHEPFEFDDVRAGAFFDITPRMRFSGQLSFTDNDDAIAQSGAFDRDVPEVKFESAFRF